MQKPTLILVSGAPGAGKTTIAARLSRNLRMPMVSKDAVKESLFDSLGWSDREWQGGWGAPA
jgi:predicted kinase